MFVFSQCYWVSQQQGAEFSESSTLANTTIMAIL
uniref:Uncharacterized protein n=1 Tax=Anguilla anguilla TaxID=7936 RepID=A0A0E9QZ88_ANGAN